MEGNLWAPWRMEYIESISGKDKGNTDKGCFICRICADSPDKDRENLLLYRAGSSVVLLNRFPYNNGHLLIAPIRHVGDLGALREDELLELARLTQMMVSVLLDTIRPEGFNIGMNIGHCAGAGLPDHLHIHIVPRWSGDTNYMSTIGKIKVIPEDLYRTYDRLAAHDLIRGVSHDEASGKDDNDDKR